MTPEDIERMAREASLIHDGGWWFSDDDQQDVSTVALTRFAALVRAQALTEAARVALDQHMMDGLIHAKATAAAIRALAGQPSAAVEAVSNPQR